jgi:SAM-dependent methyltransferase
MIDQQNFRRFEFQPAFFRQENIELAKSVILSPVVNASTEQRWYQETEYTMDIISKHWKITPETVILDYGCGIGRMAKALIDKFGCYVVGVDTEPVMQSYAIQYVWNDHFFPCGPRMLDKLDVRFDYALGIWVLLHALKPSEDIEMIRRHLMVGGGLFVINEHARRIPTTEEIMIDDGIKIADLLANEFKVVKTSQVDYLSHNKEFTDCAWYGLYENAKNAKSAKSDKVVIKSSDAA